MSTRLEVCCADIQSMQAARRGGATRVELCTGLSEGGLTPSPGLIAMASTLGFTEINVLIRSHSGDFIYDSDDMTMMIRDIQSAREAGATGIVWGGLTPTGHIDRKSLALVRSLTDNLNLTFHRAFDLCTDPKEALEAIIEEGCTSLLTSGLASSALEGADTIRDIVVQAKDRIEVIAGSGVNSANCREIAEQTGVSIVHATARHPVESMMVYHRPGVSMGTPGTDEYTRLITSSEEVRKIIEALS